MQKQTKLLIETLQIINSKYSCDSIVNSKKLGKLNLVEKR